MVVDARTTDEPREELAPPLGADPANPYAVDTKTLTGQLRPLRRAALSLGSNVGDRFDYLQCAVDALCDTPDTVAVAVSPVYETVPVGGPEGQRDFLNAVLVVDTMLDAQTLLDRCLSLEQVFGRVRAEANGPRTLDIDLLCFGDRVLNRPGLQVPHPRLAERAFVLVPWSDVDPGFPVPGLGEVGALAGRVRWDGVRRIERVLVLP